MIRRIITLSDKPSIKGKINVGVHAEISVEDIREALIGLDKVRHDSLTEKYMTVDEAMKLAEAHQVLITLTGRWVYYNGCPMYKEEL
jgi:3-deoxy-D-arabino-heptulosonate 7-phosphate (DAHP) synthase class II